MARGGGDLSLDMQVDAFNACLRDMQRKLATTHTMEQVVDYEVGRIVNQAIRKTARATKRSIMRSQWERPPWRTYNIGGKMRKYSVGGPTITKDGRIIPTGYRHNDGVWDQIQQRLNQSLALKFQARELARRVWVEIIKKLGQRIEAGGQAQIAKSKSFVPSSAAAVDRFRTTGSYGVEIENSYGKNRWVGAAQALFSAIAGRRKYFERNVAAGVFNDLKKIAKEYPGMTVTY